MHWWQLDRFLRVHERPLGTFKIDMTTANLEGAWMYLSSSNSHARPCVHAVSVHVDRYVGKVWVLSTTSTTKSARDTTPIFSMRDRVGDEGGAVACLGTTPFVALFMTRELIETLWRRDYVFRSR
jgi:hypothetical protein